MTATPVEGPTVDPGAAGGEGGRAGRWGFAHVPALDGLRGAAVAAVLLYHAGHLDGGYLGVDLFFVLSGFLITSLLLAEHGGTGGIDLRTFWVRRARRLLPALLGMVAGVAVYAQVVARPVDLGQIRGDGLATVFYVANWHTIWQGTSYWDLSLAPSPLQHTWSLAIEEQFYLLWPLVVVGLARRWSTDLPRTVGRVALVGAALSAALFVGLHLAGASDTRVYEGTDTRAAALLVGVALAAHRRGLAARLAPWTRELAGLAAAVVLAVLWVRLDGQSPWLYRGGLPLASVLAVVVIGAACAPGSPVLGRVLAVRPLRALGLISYGLYLWHWPLYVAIDQRNGRYPLLGDLVLSGPGLLAVKLGASLVAALVSYRLLEQPIRLGALRGRIGLGAALGGTVAVALLVVVATTGAVSVPEGGDEDQQAVELIEGPTVMFVGDSVALSVVRPILDDPLRYGVNALNQTRIGCSRLGETYRVRNFAGNDVEQPACASDPVVEGWEPPDAVVLYLGARPNDWIEVDGTFVRACDPAYDDALRAAVVGHLEELTAGGAPGVLVTLPRSGENALPVEGSEARIACANRVLAAAAAAVPGVALLDMDDLICPGDGACREELGGDPIRSDGIHYDEGPGGQRVADWVVERVLELTGLEAHQG